MANDFGALSGAARGEQGAAAWNKGTSPERMANRQEAYRRQEESYQSLRKMRAEKPTDAQLTNDVENMRAQLEEQQRVIKETITKNHTNSLLNRWALDTEMGDFELATKNLNAGLSAMQNDSNAANLWNDISNVRVAENTPEDRQLLLELGVSPDLVESIMTVPAVKANYPLMEQTNGETRLGDFDAFNKYTENDLIKGKVEQERTEILRQSVAANVLGLNYAQMTPLMKEALSSAIALRGTGADPKDLQETYLKEIENLIRKKRFTTDKGALKDKIAAEAHRRTINYYESQNAEVPGVDSPDYNKQFTVEYDNVRRSANTNAGFPEDSNLYFDLVEGKTESERSRWITAMAAVESKYPGINVLLDKGKEVREEFQNLTVESHNSGVYRDSPDFNKYQIDINEAKKQIQSVVAENYPDSNILNPNVKMDSFTPQQQSKLIGAVKFLMNKNGVNTNKVFESLGELRKFATATLDVTKLSSKDVGLFNRLFDVVAEYTPLASDNTQASATWSLLANITRNTLFGATVTNAEMGKFNAQFGTLYQNYSALVDKLIVNLKNQQSGLSTITEIAGPVPAKILGASVELNNVQKAIDLLEAKVVAYRDSGKPSSRNSQVDSLVNQSKDIDAAAAAGSGPPEDKIGKGVNDILNLRKQGSGE